MGKIFVISVVSHRQSKTLINNTTLEVDDMDSTFIELYEIRTRYIESNTDKSPRQGNLTRG